MSLSRRAVLAGGLALSACDRAAHSQTLAAPGNLPPLKDVAQFPVGTCVRSDQLTDPVFARLAAEQFSQLTPEWEMKMEYIVQDNGSFRFDGPDRIAAFARQNGMRLFGHTLVWYIHRPKAFEQLDEGRVRFVDAYRNYITAVVGRYRGQAVGWDVVNETIEDDGSGIRDSLWAERLGKEEHIGLACRFAHAADPDVPLFLNDYFLETMPKKRAAFLRLVERLLKAGVPLSGLGTQTHLIADQPPGLIKAAIADLASVGLPIHVSEMDVSIAGAKGLLKDPRDLVQTQARLYAEAAEAFSSLPARQRFAFTVWGVRDSDSWRRNEAADDTPLLFDVNGRPKAAAQAWEQGLR